MFFGAWRLEGLEGRGFSLSEMSLLFRGLSFYGAVLGGKERMMDHCLKKSLSRFGGRVFSLFLLTGILCFASAAFFADARARSSSSGIESVVELFTSQGCSSCPPADRLAQELAMRDDLLVLSLAVDYWDYLGWKDSLATPQHTKRQRDYSRAMGKGGAVYTPQMVVNGERDVVGSRRAQVERLLARKSRFLGRAPLNLSLKEGKLHIDIGARQGGGTVGATVWLMPFVGMRRVNILRGENRGRDLTYVNVVRNMMPVGMWHGEALSLTIPADTVPKDGGAAVLVQENGHGAIWGAARIVP